MPKQIRINFNPLMIDVPEEATRVAGDLLDNPTFYKPRIHCVGGDIHWYFLRPDGVWHFSMRGDPPSFTRPIEDAITMDFPKEEWDNLQGEPR